MKCPYCHFEDSKVIDSRDADNKKRRRRECISCGKRFTTYETIELIPLMVKKADGTYQPYSREKLFRGLLTATKKRPISLEKLNSIVDEVEEKFAKSMQGQISSAEIGSVLLEELRKLDTVAYVRFASVYKDFDSTRKFIELISELDK
ncbi:MAG: transcriptional regulator NrdR [Oscillospiraceae bacterium]|jgi:transcriptional repressor NrdR|nr:transcriptional regulator NrdR [Oscillospiraceae bacterium]